MNHRLDHNTKPPERLKDLWEHAQEIWTDFLDDFLQKLYERMPKHLDEVIKNKGGNTKH